MFKYSPTLRLQKANAKAIFPTPVFHHIHTLFEADSNFFSSINFNPRSSVTTFLKTFFCLGGNYPKAHISWKVHHHDPIEFSFHGSCWDCLESVVESVWQPAVSCAALHSCGIITGYLCFPDSQIFSPVWLMVLCGQSCIKNLALCRRSWEDTLVAGRIQQCCWSYNLFAVLEAWRCGSRHSFKSPYTRLKEPKFSSNLCFRPEKGQRPLSQLKCLSENLKNMLLLLPWS